MFDPPHQRKTTVESMMGRDASLPPYDPLSDPHLADYFARKFGWTSAAAPPGSGSARGTRTLGRTRVRREDTTGRRTHSAPGATTKTKKKTKGDTDAAGVRGRDDGRSSSPTCCTLNSKAKSSSPLPLSQGAKAR
jgi:hypothetical protein